MYRDDFILRHIRLFVQAIARVLGLIEDGDPAFALETVRVSFTDLLGMGMDDFLAYPNDRVKEFLYFGELGPMGLNRTAFAASMLALAARIYEEMEKPDMSLACREKALRVLLETVLGDEEVVEFPDFAPSVEEILDAAPIRSYSDEVVAMLAFYFDRSGDLKRADEAIRLMLDRRPLDPDTRDMARSFYEYLLETEAGALEAHGLSLEGVRKEMDRLE
jgi:hypothetical protein